MGHHSDLKWLYLGEEFLRRLHDPLKGTVLKDRKLLMIPGPIEFEPAVLQAMGAPTNSHVAPEFIECFGAALEMMREVWLCPGGQPFILAGSGTLAMDSAGANLIEPGDRALVISTGYFGERYAALLKRYGADVTILRAGIGDVIPPATIEDKLKKGSYKVLTFTHVDTSTAVLVDPESIGVLGRKYGVLTILDGVCSVGGEEIRQEEWGLDVVLTASQKAIGVPPGLALFVVSGRAMEVWKKRTTPVGSYYADWSHWLPIMEAYESRTPAYFATPSVNLVEALHVSLKSILEEGMAQRFDRHRMLARAFRSAMKALELQRLPLSDDWAAHTLSALYYPHRVSGSDFLGKVQKSGILLAGGLHPDIKSRYFRVGHMGAVNQNDILATVGAIAKALEQCGHQTVGVEALKAVLREIHA
jgi:alanine-glyoxylate transaminase/serine-glyoxylate transaminase/serine-pyruvate transaminase